MEIRVLVLAIDVLDSRCPQIARQFKRAAA
jgi:hypothetical protein